MAMIKCPECTKEISDKAAACPHCGCPASAFHAVAEPPPPPPPPITMPDEFKADSAGGDCAKGVAPVQDNGLAKAPPKHRTVKVRICVLLCIASFLFGVVASLGGVVMFSDYLVGAEPNNTSDAGASRIAELEAQVSSLQARDSKPEPAAPPVGNQGIEEPQEEQENFGITVEVLGKTNIPQDIHNYQFSDMVMFSIMVTNLSRDTIRGVEGVLNVSDIFGKQFLSIECDITGIEVVPNSRVTINELGMDVNQFIDNQVKLYTTDFEDLQFEYVISQVV